MKNTINVLILLLLVTGLYGRKSIGAPAYHKMPAHFKAYVEEHITVATTEHSLFGVPASITLAQGLLESAAGTSDHVRLANNHFGIKAKDGNPLFVQLAIGKVKFSEGDFAKYASTWWCFRHHSKLLTSGSYAHILSLSGNNYKGWAYRLKRVGYAEDPHYVRKLIKLIENFELWRADGHSKPVANPNTRL